MSATNEAAELKAAVDAHYKNATSSYIDKVTSETGLLLIWIDYLRNGAKK